MNYDKISKKNFIYNIIDEDLKLGKCISIHTRFSPEPNGYLHLGHAKSICLNFDIAKYYFGKFNLRFDDTNPIKEDKKYIESIKKDIKWLEFNWYGEIHYASDYFDQLYLYALELIKKGLAYVDELSTKMIREYRGTLICPGINSPYRNRSIDENLSLFVNMRNGKFEEGSSCLRAKIDMSSPYIIMRDPVLYRIKFVNHHKTGDKWCIYPMYDFTHCISDALEGITHSICTLEFLDNRILYNWILNNISIKSHPNQYEFSRLNIEYSILSKRKIKILIKKNIIDDWDDPRILTISGLRRRGYTANSIKEFCRKIGVTKQNSNIKMSLLESCIRKDLNNKVPRIMAVINPVKVVIENLPEGYEEFISMPNHPNIKEFGTREVVFSREIVIDRSDFREYATNQYKRLVLGREIRLRYAYVIRAKRIEKDKNGEIKTIYCYYDPTTLNKHPEDGRKISGVIHWVSYTKNVPSEFRLYEKLFLNVNPDVDENFLNFLNKESLIIRYGVAEKIILKYKAGKNFQIEREGYFCTDSNNFKPNNPVFHRTVGLRNSNKFN